MKEEILDIAKKLYHNHLTPETATNLLLDLFAVSDWLEFEGNESIFNEYAKRNCLCKFDDGAECRYEDEHPMAILTHFRCR